MTVAAHDKICKPGTDYYSIPVIYDGRKKLKLHKDYEYSDEGGLMYYYDSPAEKRGLTFSGQGDITPGCSIRVIFTVSEINNFAYYNASGGCARIL